MKKALLLLLTMVMGVALLAACSDDGNNPPNNTETPNGDGNGETPNGDGGSGDGSAEITAFGLMYDSQFEERIGQYLKEKFPEYEFNYISFTKSSEEGVTVEELVTTGTEIDLLIGASGNLKERWMPAELVHPLDDLMEKHGVNPDVFEAPYMQQVTLEGSTYLLPFSNSGMVTYVNRDIFNKFGVAPPVNGMTWDESIALAEEVTRSEGGFQYIGQWYSPEHMMRMNQFSLSLVDPETKEANLLDPKWNEWVTKLFKEPFQDPGVQNAAKRGFFGHHTFRNDQLVGMYTYTTGWMRNHETNLGLNWDVVSMPTFENGYGAQPYASYLGVSTTSSDKDATMKIIKYLTGKEFQTNMARRGFMPVLKDEEVKSQYYADVDVGDRNVVDAIFANEMAPARVMTPYDEVVIEGAMGQDVLPEIVRGNIDVNTGLRNAQQIANNAIQAEMARRQ